MNDLVPAGAAELARLRRRGVLPVAGLPVAAMEAAAEEGGRRLHVAGRADDEPVLVLGWSGPEPVASAQAPRLTRRRLSLGTVKAFLVVYALREPHSGRTTVTTDTLVRVLDRLTGRSSRVFVVPAVEETLPRAGLLEPVQDGWRVGPMVEAWDVQTREVVQAAAQRLYDHPGWREASGD